jgi:hypothetical protein
VQQHKFLKVQAQCIVIYIPTTYTSTIDEDLDWIDFVNTFDLINTNVFTYEHALNKFPNLTHFLFSWSKHRKNKGVPFVGHEHMPPSFWRSGPRKSEAS